jgi:hypothetical protein
MASRPTATVTHVDAGDLVSDESDTAYLSALYKQIPSLVVAARFATLPQWAKM